MWARSLGLEDPLEEETATHSSILAWRLLWTEEPGRLQSLGSQRVGHDWSDLACTQVCMESGLPSWKRRTASRVWKDIGSTADLTPSIRVCVLCCPPACSVGVLLSVLFHGLQEWLSPLRGPTQTKLGCVRGVSEHRGRRMKWQSFPLTRCHFPIVSFSWPWGSVDAPGGAWAETRGVLGLGTPPPLPAAWIPP